MGAEITMWAVKIGDQIQRTLIRPDRASAYKALSWYVDANRKGFHIPEATVVEGEFVETAKNTEA